MRAQATSLLRPAWAGPLADEAGAAVPTRRRVSRPGRAYFSARRLSTLHRRARPRRAPYHEATWSSATPTERPYAATASAYLAPPTTIAIVARTAAAWLAAGPGDLVDQPPLRRRRGGAHLGRGGPAAAGAPHLSPRRGLEPARRLPPRPRIATRRPGARAGRGAGRHRRDRPPSRLGNPAGAAPGGDRLHVLLARRRLPTER